ncbi:MAG: TrkH family potassium uptake protein [Defluviimonas sp.]|uniref:TrkH family potassium uptake protein n=1 Tax=Albidovulum sp. TaxID=1872424 RepID=UPI001D294FB0|nr:TrkH family potassium uptake protein [Paracoccaceae bacterium]MCC0063952.1 TrkH family potassium uptake protein [Defluviimonas sp.]
MRRLVHLPILVILMGISALAMYLPAIHGFVTRHYDVSRSFFYSGTLLLVFAALIGLATAAGGGSRGARNQLLSLVATFTILPAFLAVPFWDSVADTSFTRAWWEMVSSLTTTGGTLYAPERLVSTLHLWRALVGWMGGLYFLVLAAAVLAPMNLGGYEVLSGATAGRGAVVGGEALRGSAPNERIWTVTKLFFPFYGALTLILWVALLMAGDRPLVALCHAMSTLATSGISPVGGLAGARSGVGGEAIIAVFMVFALSRNLFPRGRTVRGAATLMQDPELRMAALLVTVVPVLLFLRHWIAAYEVSDLDNTVASFQALWGAFFSVISFLTTTGFESVDWGSARQWSGLGTPGLILAGLSVIGGGVATTAGGVKLLRVYVLFRHGEREIERLVHPHSVGGSGIQARRLRRQGAQMAWIFFMLFAISIAGTMLALSLTGLDFVSSTVVAVSALSTTGPLVTVAAEAPLHWADLDSVALTISAAAMVLGRLETLALVALLNPAFWSR